MLYNLLTLILQFLYRVVARPGLQPRRIPFSKAPYPEILTGKNTLQFKLVMNDAEL
jgi:hypothetical protein